jgi:hypothetical protein
MPRSRAVLIALAATSFALSFNLLRTHHNVSAAASLAGSVRPGAKKPIAAHIAIAADLDGSWLAFRWDDKAPNRFHALELWGFDKAANHFTNFIYDNFGGVRQFNSAGWEGDTLTWTGNTLATPPALNERFVIERKSPKEFVISYGVRKQQGDWGDRRPSNLPPMTQLAIA